MQQVLEISLLGGVALRRQGQPASSPSSRSIGLLTYLALHADVALPRQHLAGIFWPDSTEAQARTNLRRELHQLRSLLDDDSCLVVKANVLAWRDTAHCKVDLRTFALERQAARAAEASGDIPGLVRHSCAAIDEYRGPLLPGWYDDWLLEARDDLHRQCISLCDRAVNAVKGSGELAQALPLARRRVQLAPLEEPGYRQLMELQADTGDRAGAMTTYHRCASILEQELGVTPSPETIHAKDAVIGAGGGVRPEDQTARQRRDRPGQVGPSLVGRDADLSALLSRWASADTGHPGMVLVSGEAGVGKTRLVAEFSARLAQQGVVVASARCFGASGRLALAPVADWLRSPQLRATEEALDQVWRDEVQRLVPHTSMPSDRSLTPLPFSSSVASRAKVDSWQRLRFFEGLARAVLEGQRPTVLVLDDLQWCDNDTMLWLSFLLELAAGSRLLVVATARSEELADNPGVLASMRSLHSAGIVTDISLASISVGETAQIAAQLLGRVLPDDEVLLLHSATGGVALYVVEALRNLRSTPGEAALAADDVSTVLHKRLGSVSDAAREVAGLAAAVGRDFDLELLSEASDLDADSVVRAVDELWLRRIVRQSGQGYDFSHDLLRDTAYGLVRPAQQWLHHRRLAEAIERLHPGRLDDVAAQLAHHYARSGRAVQALPFYVRAAEAASGVFANAEAVRLLRLGLDLLEHISPEHERHLRELEVLQAISAPLNALHGYASPELRAVLTRSVHLAETLKQPKVELASLVGLWASLFVQGDTAGSNLLAARALQLGQSIPELAGQAHFAVAGSSASLGLLDVSVEHFDRACDLSIGAVSMMVGTRPEVHAQAWSAHARWLLGDAEGAVRACRESIQRAREVDHPYTLAVALAYAAITHQVGADLPGLDQTLGELTEICGRYDLAYYPEWALVLRGWRTGGSVGVDLIRSGLAHLSAQHSFARTPYWLSLLASTHQARGDDEAARAALDAAAVAAAQHDDRWWLPEVLRMSAVLQPRTKANVTLRAAIELASSQNSVTLLRRCRDDLARLGVGER